MRKKLQVFISSTFTDLIDERQIAVKAVLNSGHIPAGMELFTAGDESQKQIIKRWIDESDAYVLILGGRYGSIDKETGKSYTHWEYDYAGEAGKPRFAIVLSDNAIQNKVITVGLKNATEQNNPQLHKDFREGLLAAKLVSPVDDHKDIEISIFKSLREIEQRSDLSGWVSGKDVPNVKDLLEENAKLNRENGKLKSENVKLKLKPEKVELYNGNTYEEVRSYLLNTFIELPEIIDKNKGNASLLTLILNAHSRFATGITNRYDMASDDEFLFFKVAPKLMSFDLVEKNKIAGVKYEKIQFSKQGHKFIARLEIETSKMGIK
ncbi:hypothetical protein QFZ81_000999 [Paenibacillus sp. V4I9]|uniref:DUF4062 domain-containing protein n=1 Tax=Paenibacillus sp. V4I9 TaxID=3042308 RepID=UPI002784CD63|nr:DUF4062 domain-containing protein [Paenibacillus sp. V4I9]MDQ0885911.1 hypothetical protein [Paenibacillus sp. V4I9]